MAHEARIKAEAIAAAQRSKEEQEMIKRAREEMMARVSKFDDGIPCWPEGGNHSVILMDDLVVEELVSEMAMANIGPDHRPHRRSRFQRRVFYAIFAGVGASVVLKSNS